MVGHRCVTETEIYFTTTGLERHRCTLECMRWSSCTIVYYNLTKDHCLIGSGTCVSLQVDKEYQVNVFSHRKRDGCLKWVSGAELIHPVGTSSCTLGSCHVGRLVSPPKILPGRYRVNKHGDWLKYGDGAVEALNVEPDCQVAWMYFTAGDVMPPHAIAGGYLAISRSALYIMEGNLLEDNTDQLWLLWPHDFTGIHSKGSSLHLYENEDTGVTLKHTRYTVNYIQKVCVKHLSSVCAQDRNKVQCSLVYSVSSKDPFSWSPGSILSRHRS